jgi:uncharacterized protein YciI
MKLRLVILFSIAAVFCQAQSKTYSVVFLNTNPEAPKIGKDEADKIMQGHMQRRVQLAKEGKLLAAGPFEGGGGLYIMNTTSPEEARSWISDDPGVKASRWIIEILPYIPRHGGVCAVGEKYTMINYAFVRFDVIVSKATAQNYPELLLQHDKFLKEIIAAGNVITEASFGERDGGILVLQGNLEAELIEADPAVQQGLIQFQIKKYYTAKGSFCEE